MHSETPTRPSQTEGKPEGPRSAANSFGRRKNRMSKREKKMGEQGGQPQPGQGFPQKQGGQPGQPWQKPAAQPEHKPTTWPTQPGQGR